MEIFIADGRLLEAEYERALALVTPARAEAAGRMRRRDRALASLAAGLLLRAKLGVTEDCMLTAGKQGKPRLTRGGACFSISHSGSLAALAVSGSEVGVDIEQPGGFPAAVAQRCFTPDERRWARGEQTLLRALWTRKESVMKLTGLGLALPPGSFSALPGEECTAIGTARCIFTLVADKYILSAAADEPFCADISVADPRALM